MLPLLQPRCWCDGESGTHAAHGVRIASANGRFPHVRGQLRGELVAAGGHRSILCFHTREDGFEPNEIRRISRAGKRREQMVDAEQQLLFVQVT